MNRNVSGASLSVAPILAPSHHTNDTKGDKKDERDSSEGNGDNHPCMILTWDIQPGPKIRIIVRSPCIKIRIAVLIVYARVLDYRVYVTAAQLAGCREGALFVGTAGTFVSYKYIIDFERILRVWDIGRLIIVLGGTNLSGWLGVLVLGKVL